MDGFWQVQLSALARQDYRHILHWSKEKFGVAQAKNYAVTLSAALQDLTAGPDIVGGKDRSTISPGVKMLHVARKGHKGSHIVLFRVASAKVAASPSPSELAASPDTRSKKVTRACPSSLSNRKV